MKSQYSIIVPLYNVHDLMKPCVDTLLGQNFIHYELLLIDDGSTDGSADICDAYAAKDPRIKAYHRENQGVSAARNFGVSQAQGEYILFLDADDYYTDSTMLEKIDQRLKTSDMVVFGVVGSLNGNLMSDPIPYASLDGLKSEYFGYA